MSEFIEKDGRVIAYEVTYKNNKNTYYRVKPGYVAVTANKRYPKVMIANFLMTHFDKFYHILNQQPIDKTNEITLWGKSYQLVLTEGNFKYEMNEDIVIVHSRQDIITTKKRIYQQELIKQVHVISEVIQPVLANQKISIVPLKYKYLKSKFGSYHRRHDEITLNTFLATLDPIFLTYVLYHEYAHTKVFDHSKRFYQLLDQLMPGHKTIQKRLKSVVII